MKAETRLANQNRVRGSTMSIFLISAMLMLPISAYGQTIYFQADAETGDLTQWIDGRGGVFYTPYVSASQEVVHSGKWAYKHDLPDPSSENNAKFMRWDIEKEEAYYSTWYYIAEGFVDTKWKNIIQWKTTSHDPTFFIGPRKYGTTRELVLSHWACQQGYIPCVNFPQYGNGLYRQQNPIPVPDTTWFHIEVYYKASATNGQIIVWQDGVEIFSLSDPKLNTLHSKSSDNQFVYWGAGNYVAGASTGGRHLLYTDDTMVTDYRVGTGFEKTDITPPAPPKNVRIGQ